MYFKLAPLLLLLVVLLDPPSAAAQEKVEREYRVRSQNVPEEARSWLKDAYERSIKVKWYVEKTADRQFYEAKFEWENHRHSVKFDSAGTIYDIEIEMSWKELDNDLRHNLKRYFESNYQKHEIRKIQKQYSGSSDDLEDAIDEQEIDNVTIRYEIEFYGKSERDDELWEGLFDAEGHLIERRIIKLRPADNLIY